MVVPLLILHGNRARRILRKEWGFFVTTNGLKLKDVVFYLVEDSIQPFLKLEVDKKIEESFSSSTVYISVNKVGDSHASFSLCS